MLNVSARNVFTFTSTFIVCILIVTLTIKTLIKLHNKDQHSNKQKISKFFRIVPTIASIGICISSIAICIGQGLWLFGTLWSPWIIAYTTLQHGITFLLIGIIFVGRLYFTSQRFNFLQKCSSYLKISKFLTFFQVAQFCPKKKLVQIRTSAFSKR